MDGFRSILELDVLQLPQAQAHKERPRLMTSCDNCQCCLKQIKFLQVKSQVRCKACETENPPCQFSDLERYFAERSRKVTGTGDGSSPALTRGASSQSIDPSAISPTRGDSDRSGVKESFSANKVSLLPALPSTIRDFGYRGTVCVSLSPNIGPLGVDLVSAPSYESQGWTISTHLEEKHYAHIKSQSGITVVTEANVTEPGVSDQLNAWLDIVCNMAIEKHVHIPETSHLFLEIHQDARTCNYYFADHGLRTIFWLHTLNTISVGLPPSKSDSHLQHSLEENYWIHVELFPGTASQYSAKALNELQVVFSHAHTDTPTSEVLAFTYTAQECGEFVDLLERCKDHVSSPCVITYVASVWRTVTTYRSFVHYGDVHHQLSSNQSTLAVPDSKRSLVLEIISKMLLFGIPDHYEAQFKSVSVDQIDTFRWHEHVAETVEDLKQTRSSILALLSASIPTMQMTPFSGLIKASLFLCAFDLAVTSFLLQQQRRLLFTNTSTSVAYLKDQNTGYGFKPIAIIHSLPQALFVWGLLLFSMQGFWMTFADLSLVLLLSTLLPVAAIMVVVCLGIWLVVRPRPDPIEDAIPSITAVKQNEHTNVEYMV